MGCGASSSSSAYAVDDEECKIDSRSLFRAMMSENTELLVKMLDKGADINATNAAGLTLLQVATERGKRKSRTLLRMKGASRFDNEERRRLHGLLNSVSRFEDCHTLGDPIGSGGFSSVYAGTRREHGAAKTFSVAVKVVEKDSSFEIEDLLFECDMMRKCARHPHIVNFYDAFDSTTHFNIVLEYMSGGDLFTTIVDRFEANSLRFSEREVYLIFVQLLSAVKACHDFGVCHRDIKPENLLTSAEAADGAIKLCDFGLAVEIPSDGRFLYEVCGSLEYCAPEMVRNTGYLERIDMWALGVILYILFSGCSPFQGGDASRTFSNITKLPLTLPASEWESVSDHAQDLVTSLLQRNPEKRLTADGALERAHQWAAASKPIDEDTVISEKDSNIEKRYRRFSAVIPGGLERIKKYNMQRRLKGAMHAVRGARRFSSDVIMWRTEHTSANDAQGGRLDQAQAEAKAEAEAEAAVLSALEDVLGSEEDEKEVLDYQQRDCQATRR
eukprot:SAG31_NODE_646_length_13223_cov_14.088845_11_plen_501_part_00